MIASDGVWVEVEDCGRRDAPALLFINSIGCDRSLWDEQAQALSDAFRIILFDARGHGRSEAPSGDYSLERMGQDALEVLDALGVKRAHVCGLSLGGLVAQWLAVHAPERVDRLVLSNTASRIGTADAWEIRRRAVLVDGLGGLADLAMGRFFSGAFRAARPAAVAGFRARFERGSAAGYAGCCAVLRDADMTDRLGQIVGPTLVIGGEHDVSTPLHQAQALAEAIPGARFIRLAAAHLSNIEQPAAFSAAVRAHLESA